MQTFRISPWHWLRAASLTDEKLAEAIKDNKVELVIQAVAGPLAPWIGKPCWWREAAAAVKNLSAKVYRPNGDYLIVT